MIAHAYVGAGVVDCGMIAKCCAAVSWEREGVELNLVLILDTLSAFEA